MHLSPTPSLKYRLKHLILLALIRVVTYLAALSVGSLSIVWKKLAFIVPRYVPIGFACITAIVIPPYSVGSG